MAQTEECAPLTAGARSRIAAYAAQQFELAPDVRVEGGEAIAKSCFRRVTVQSVSPKKTIVLYLSPDQRFLSETLLDTSVDPAIERQRAARVVQTALLADRSPSRGPADAAVTVVEFSDFQCPFCKREADALAEIPEDLRDSVRVVFKQRPLPMHPWARPAAMASICAGLQNEAAFWAIERYLFTHQDAIKPETASAMIRGFVSKDAQLSVERFDACLAGKEAESVLLRDEKLAQVYHVDSTPTVFINGVRKSGFSGPSAFWPLLRAAVAESHDGRVGEPEAKR